MIRTLSIACAISTERIYISLQFVRVASDILLVHISEASVLKFFSLASCLLPFSVTKVITVSV